MTTPTITLHPNNIAVLKLGDIDKLDPRSCGEIGSFLNEYIKMHAGDGSIMIIDLSTIEALHASVPTKFDEDGTAYRFHAGDALMEISAVLEQNNIGCIYAGLKPAFEEALDSSNHTKKLTLEPNLKEALSSANLLQVNPDEKADWMGSSAPSDIVAKLKLNKDIPPLKSPKPNYYVMTIPWDSPEQEHADAFRRMTKNLAAAEKSLGGKRVVILDMSTAVNISEPFLKALADFRKSLELRGDVLRMVFSYERAEDCLTEFPLTREIPVFTSIKSAVNAPIRVGKS